MADLKLQIVLNAMGNARQRFEEVTNAGSHLTRQLRETQAESKSLRPHKKTLISLLKAVASCSSLAANWATPKMPSVN